MAVEYEPADVYTQIDPRLQRLIDLRERALPTAETALLEDVGEVAVIARVTSAEAWEAIDEVQMGAELGEVEEGSIVTGRIPLDRIEAVRQNEAVLSLKAAQKLRPLLAASIEETEARADLLPPNAQGRQGEGVIVGLVDFGCDFAHHNVRNVNGTSRVRAIWNQKAAAGAESPFGVGRVHRRDAINQALESADPYGALGYGPPPDSQLPRPGTHGTHTMDIAAGNGRGSNVPGFAPKADILFVEPATTDIIAQGPGVVGSDFGDSARLLEAVSFIFNEAEAVDRPCVVNISLGTNGGPHDGTSLVEQGIDAVLRARDNRAVVIAASNSFDDDIHAAGTVPAGGSVDLGWVIPTQDPTQNEVEIWYPGDDELALELLTPDGSSVGTVPLGESGRVTGDDGQVLLFVSHRAHDPNNGDNVIGVFLETGLPEGTWTLRLHGKTVVKGGFHAWIERDDASQSSFAAPDRSHTLGSISCGHESIVVGSYDAHLAAKPLSKFSSAGPTRDGRQKPEISAPGHKVLAAHSRTGTGVVEKSGTSMAAPAVTGTVALVLAEAHARGRSLPSAAIRSIVRNAARRSPPAGADWDSRYGMGRIDAKSAIVEVIDGAPHA
jgi:subtilisin family serine protease